MTALRIPVATYRLQFNCQFRFKDAQALVPYLHDLGITDLYASPLVQARRGSSHAYDVTDPSRLNPELGTEEEFNTLVSELRRHGMGLLLDIVPNHMAASSENPWWMDVLEDGPASPYADFFHIDWRPGRPELGDKVLLPILGDSYRKVLENQELILVLEEGGFGVRYHEAKLPIALKSYSHLLAHRLDTFEKSLGSDQRAAKEIRHLLHALTQLPVASDAHAAQKRQWEREALKARLWELYPGYSEIKEFLDENLQIFNGKQADAGSFELLDRLLAKQHYALTFWRTGTEQINYRRFFDITNLVSLRIEDPKVFEARHALLLRLAAAGHITGVRVDHVDGLYDPLGYLRRLRDRLAARSSEAQSPSHFYVIVEKILTGDEALPTDWPVCGTTGYDFLNTLNGIFVDPDGSGPLDALYRRFAGSRVSLAQVVYEKKKLVINSLFPGEARALAASFARLAKQDNSTRAVSVEDLALALVEVTACLPVYRIYIRDFELAFTDRRYINQALKDARRRNQAGPKQAFDFLRSVLLLEGLNDLPMGQRQARLEFVMRWQQFTGSVMAKGFEDTTLYVYNRLVSLNEVGGDPQTSGITTEVFHRRLKTRAKRWPCTLNTTSTHDTKRGEDVRARINVLSELPKKWEKCLVRWSRWNRTKKRVVNGQPVPDPNEELLLYQTLLGAWPFEEENSPTFCERLQDYVIKAAREAKVHTRWRDINTAHEQALRDFVESILKKSLRNRFLLDFQRFQKTIAFYGALNGLAQVLLKIGAPGVADFYQGAELWDFRLVDPDNRRPVDFKKRAEILNHLKRKEATSPLALVRELLHHWQDGRTKLYLIWTALNFRRAHPELFLEGAYIPLCAKGKMKASVCAFARHKGNDWAVVAVPRLLTKPTIGEEIPVGEKIWGKGTLMLPARTPESWINVLTGETLEAVSVKKKRALRLSTVFHSFPAALLTGAYKSPSAASRCAAS